MPAIHTDGRGNMSKREIVVLVSRALSIIQIVTVLLEVTYLPQELLGLFHHIFPLQTPVFGDYLSRSYMEAVLALIARIAICSFAAVLLWKCGPDIERFLTPSETRNSEAGSAS
jgi:hypothetical protein